MLYKVTHHEIDIADILHKPEYKLEDEVSPNQEEQMDEKEGSEKEKKNESDINRPVD